MPNLRRDLAPQTLLLLSLAGLSACSKAVPEVDGTLARVDGKVQRVSDADKAKICAENFCEPNYVVQASFGRWFGKSRPAPAPVSAPAPTPEPEPSDPPANGGSIPVPPVPPDTDPEDAAGPVTDPKDYSKGVLRLPEAWEVTHGSREVIVAVIDTGVDVSHPDLAGNIWINTRERDGTPGVDNDGNGFVGDIYGWDFANDRANALDDNHHGTHVAGIIGARANGTGTVGVAPKVRIMPVKFLTATGSGTTYNAIRAIEYAVANGANVISNSWGGGGYSQLLNDAIQKAVQKGILVVAAAGNEATNMNQTPGYPASYPNVISVASTDANDALSSFSNYGADNVMIAAPGDRIYSTYPNGAYAFLSGTSMAAPQVSGALALALSLNHSLAPDRLKQALCETSVHILPDKVKCGRMDVAALVQSLAH